MPPLLRLQFWVAMEYVLHFSKICFYMATHSGVVHTWTFERHAARLSYRELLTVSTAYTVTVMRRFTRNYKYYCLSIKNKQGGVDSNQLNTLLCTDKTQQLK